MKSFKILIIVSFLLSGLSLKAQTDSLTFAVNGMRKMKELNFFNKVPHYTLSEINSLGIIFKKKVFNEVLAADGTVKNVFRGDTTVMYFYSYPFSKEIRWAGEKGETLYLILPFAKNDKPELWFRTRGLDNEKEKEHNQRCRDSLNKFVTYLSIAGSYYKYTQKHFADSLTSFTEKVHANNYEKVKPAITEEQRKLIVQANLLTEQGKYFDALEKLNECIEYNPYSYPDAYYNAALLFETFKVYSMAIFYMQKYLILAPNAEDARKSQDKIYEWELLNN